MSFRSPFGVICPGAEPLRSCHADIRISSPVGAFNGGIYVRNLNPAGSGITPQGLLGRNTQYPVPGNKSASSGSFTFFLFDDTKVIDFWKGWSKLCYDPEQDRVGLFNEVAGSARMTIHTAQGAPVVEWSMSGCWPSNVQPSGTDSQSDGEAATFDVTLEVTSIS